MTFRRRRLDRRGGVILDLVLALGLVLLGAYGLETIGISFHEILHGALRFFGLA
jgi:hypothetical protein